MGTGDTIACCMKHKVVLGHPEIEVREAAVLMAKNSIETLPVVDGTLKLVGVTTMDDVIQIFLPDFVALLPNLGFVKDYGHWETPSGETIRRAESLLVADVMREVVSVESDCTLIRALSLMHKHRLQELPVVKEGKLVGIATRVEIGRAFLSTWLTSQSSWAEIQY